jgi:hypothetical protein
MKTKLQTLKDAAATNNWKKAISIAAKFPRLGSIRNEVLDAHMAYTNPRFLTQVGKNVDECIEAGKLALIIAYSIEH